ncbi:hypothetical protein BWD07_12055, partial [Neisseria canis]|uniref:RHS repeat-associated core domain-containing protein n=1 Tax=Neisseria canis TaxID=493 RepID=UPI000A24DFEE
QYYRYDADNQLTEARIEQEGRRSEHWHYRYDALGRRVSKQNARNQTETRFLWEGSRLLQEYGDKATYTYVYTEQGSYEPLAQIVQTANRDGSKADRQILYYHNDQIGIPREMTDGEGNIVWRGEYDGWGKLDNVESANLKEDVHQPFRLQNQYADKETGLHYNFFRYYDPHCGRFTQQDPIGLWGGENLYFYAFNNFTWSDPIGLEPMEIGKHIPKTIPKSSGKGGPSFITNLMIPGKGNSAATHQADPNLRAKPDTPRSDNGEWGSGCGDKYTDHTVPDVAMINGHQVNLLGACQRHDDCYGEARTKGANRLRCDAKLKREIYQECRKQKGISARDCNALAQRTYLGVRFGGSQAWREAGGKNPWSTE